MNNDEAIVVEHNTTDRIESLYDDIRSVEKRLGTVFLNQLIFEPEFMVLKQNKHENSTLTEHDPFSISYS